jgi:tRNA threonylcarbamoyladenosine biosynthesis protein TsaB
MALILNIDTALETAAVSLAEKGNVLRSEVNESQKDHAAWLQPAIKRLLQDAGHELKEINAVAVSNGPGSYTGLRVGLATAKGLCYALNIPLVAAGTLELMAFSAVKDLAVSGMDSLMQGLPHDFLICPMIDARRMEVFTAVFDSNLTQTTEPHALILTEHSFEGLLKGHKILFLGNGSTKFQAICRHPHAIFKNFPFNHSAMAFLTYTNYIGNNFADLAYIQPLYLKEFFIAGTPRHE